MNAEIEGYIERHIEKEPPFLHRLERETNLKRVNGRMCSGHIQGRLLKMLTRMVSPQKVLELGTFTGYSALCIAEGMPEGGTLVTVEKEDELEDAIREAIEEGRRELGCGVSILLKIGEALDVCREYPDESFDMMFIDADKREYPEYYREAKRLVREGGYIIADNTLWDSHVVEEDRHDRQTEGIREFNRLVARDPDLDRVIIPFRDGLTLIRKRTKHDMNLLR